jgi:glycosyltransferase involved in cell wall biosynthesis
VFVLDEGLPYPLDSGKRIRTWQLLTSLASRHDLTLFCLDENRPEALRAVQNQGIRVLLGPRVREKSGASLYARLLANLFSPYPYTVTKHFSRTLHAQLLSRIDAENPDLIHVEWTPYARYLSGVAGRKTIITTHNIEAQIWLRRTQHSRTALEKAFFGLQALKMRAFERRRLALADEVTAVSPADLTWLRNEGISRSSLVENGVDTDYFRPNLGTENDRGILFLGSLDWYPNQDALQFFVKEIVPSIGARLPNVELTIVGRRPPSELVSQMAALPATSLCSDVADVRPFLERAGAFVVPLRIGGGSRIKILEALAAGKAVISTRVGAEGLELVSGQHLLVADTPREFADRVIEVLTQPELRRKLGANGRHLASERYTWKQMADHLELAWFRAVGLTSQTRNLGSPEKGRP